MPVGTQRFLLSVSWRRFSGTEGKEEGHLIKTRALTNAHANTGYMQSTAAFPHVNQDSPLSRKLKQKQGGCHTHTSGLHRGKFAPSCLFGFASEHVVSFTHSFQRVFICKRADKHAFSTDGGITIAIRQAEKDSRNELPKDAHSQTLSG